MASPSFGLKTAIGSASVLVLAACGGGGGDNATAALASSECVPVTDGQYYIVENGLFVPAGGPEIQVVERIVEAPRSWDQTLEATFSDLGFPWLGLNVRDEVATLTGLAPDTDAKERAFAAGELAIMNDDAGREQISLVVDGISVEGGEEGVGAALAELDDRPSLEACQDTFTRTMNGRNVEFETNSDVISSVSARLLDAVTGTAILCGDYNVEVGGHTDSRGSDAYNVDLSQRRASAVRDYLVRKNVPSDTLTAVGYGETKPLDTSGTAAAYARNRRTEFTVTERN